MSGKELLALVLMICPSFFAMALVTFTLMQQYSDVATGPTAARFVASAGERAAKARTATQKRMRDPWETRGYTKSASATAGEYCDACVSTGKFSCAYR
ncbi:MAG: hypothetical protein ABI654_15270 [Betaproteobacteria bacterium]